MSTKTRDRTDRPQDRQRLADDLLSALEPFEAGDATEAQEDALTEASGRIREILERDGTTGADIGGTTDIRAGFVGDRLFMYHDATGLVWFDRAALGL